MNEFHQRVHRALELRQKMSKANAEIEAMTKEYNELMSDPYLCDKVEGLKTGGII